MGIPPNDERAPLLRDGPGQALRRGHRRQGKTAGRPPVHASCWRAPRRWRSLRGCKEDDHEHPTTRSPQEHGAGHRGYGLRALATGLPVGFLARPMAWAQGNEGACADKAKAQLPDPQHQLAGDPLNANVPGTYDFPDIAHAADPRMAPTPISLGGQDGDGRPAVVDAAALGAGPHGVLPPRHLHQQPRQPAQDAEADGQHRQAGDVALDLRQVPGPLLRHGPGRSGLGRRRRRADHRRPQPAQRGPHRPARPADPAQQPAASGCSPCATPPWTRSTPC